MLHSFAKYLLAALFLALPFRGMAQDPVFAQYYLNLNYLNPAFAGYTNDLTAHLNSRAQYMGLSDPLISHTLSANISCEEETRLGMGLIAYHNVEGAGYLQTFNVSGQLSANFPFKVHTKHRVNKGLIAGGVQFGMGQKYLDWSRLTFSDQYSPYFKGVQNASTILQQQSSSNLYLDVGAGIRGTYEFGDGRRPKFFSAGISAFHLNRPVQSFLESDLKLEPRFSFYTFYYLGNSKRGRTRDLRYWTFGLLADYQQGLQHHTLSVFKDLNEYMSFGLSVRRQNFLFLDRSVDAVIPHFMLRWGDLSVGVSYEWTVSTLGEEKTYGSAEIGITWRFSGRNLCRTYKKSCAVKGFDMGHDLPNLFF